MTNPNKKRRIFYSVAILFSTLISMTVFQNCSKSNFASQSSQSPNSSNTDSPSGSGDGSLPPVEPTAVALTPVPFAPPALTGLIQISTDGSGTWTFDLDTAHKVAGIYTQNEAGYLVATGVAGATPHIFYVVDQDGALVAKLDKYVIQNGQYLYPLPTLKLGYFEIRPASGNAAALIPALGSRPAGFMTYAVIRTLPKDTSANFTNFSLALDGTALTAGWQETHGGYDLHKYFGVNATGVIREYNWYACANASTDPTDFCEGYFKLHLNDNDPYKNLKLYPIIDVGSRVPAAEMIPPANAWNYPPKNILNYKKYLRNLVSFAVKRYSYLPFRIYQVTWEPYIDSNWWLGLTEDQKDSHVLEMYAAVSAVVKELDPTGKVSGLTITQYNIDQNKHYERLLQKGLGPYLDVLNLHPYSWYPPEKPQLSVSEALYKLDDLETAIINLQAMNLKHIGKHLPVIGTESAFANSYYLAATPGVPYPLSKFNKASANVAQAIMAKYSGLSMYTYFYLSDFDVEPDYGLTYNLWPVGGGYTSGPQKVSPKMDVPMIRHLNDILLNAKNLGRWVVPMVPDLRAYVFENTKTKQATLAIWDPFGQMPSLSYNTGSPTVVVTDCFGNETLINTQGKPITLSLKRCPIYVRGVGGAAVTNLFKTVPAVELR